MLATLLKIPLKVIKLQIKMALLPAKVAVRLVRRFLDRDSPASGSDGWSQERPTRRSREGGAGLDAAPSASDMELQPGELRELLDSGNEFLLIDVRQAQELASNGLIEGAVHIPSQDLPHRIDDLDKAQPTVVYCHLGGRSMDAAMFLVEKGFTDVKSLGGGIVRWQSDGGEVASA
jgi:rhodanese-related sulfurtransferase